MLANISVTSTSFGDSCRISDYDKKTQCLKCKREMAQGFVADYSMAAALIASGHAGQQKTILVGHTKAPRAEGVPIGEYRSQGCGFLEFYADPWFAAR
jgi:hypothetical protein